MLFKNFKETANKLTIKHLFTLSQSMRECW